MREKVLCTDDEIVTGKSIDTNSGHMARRLSEVGPTFHWDITTDRESLLKVLRQANERAYAMMNRGLGPTVDRLSQEVAAEGGAEARSAQLE
jgi:nicotinamide-nucleotide amidase